MRYSPQEWALKFRERSSSFGAEPNLIMLAQAAASALVLRGWQDRDTQATVKKWQEAHGGLKADGKYGPASAKALAEDLGEASPPAFAQAQKSPSRSGTAASGPAAAPVPSTAWGAAAAAAPAPPAAPASPPTTTSSDPSRVSLAQKALALLLAKGWQDPATRAAMSAWQIAHGGISTEGSYGPESAAALAVDIGGPTPSPFYLPKGATAHPGLLSALQEREQAVAKELASLTGSRTFSLAEHPTAVGVTAAAAVGLTLAVMLRKARPLRPAS